ncbi:MAG: PaaI family thioesterase [Candidatus Heimdallarchaeota archaeon]|nr:MAG: PaaI family thioesterase [Candidatus Heimdallarchaeota archaeon]
MEEQKKEIPNSWEFNCFGCSPTNEHGLQLRFYLSKKGCYAEYTVSSYFCGFDQWVHGGIIASMLDEVAAWSIMSHLFRVGITREITTKYLNPVQVNTIIYVEGEIVSSDEKNAIVRSRITSKDGVVLAEAESKWSLPSTSTLAKIAGIDEEELDQLFQRVIKPIKQLHA